MSDLHYDVQMDQGRRQGVCWRGGGQNVSLSTAPAHKMYGAQRGGGGGGGDYTVAINISMTGYHNVMNSQTIFFF